jgi:hypothetical protein
MTITPDDITTETVKYLWIDEQDEEPMMGTIAILNSTEEHDALAEGLDADDPEWVHFDERIMYYVSGNLGDTIEDLYEQDNPSDFVLVK